MQRQLIGLLALSSAAILSADTLRLKDGRVVQGSLEGADRNEIRFQADDRGPVQRFDRYDVDTIEFGGQRRGANYRQSPNPDRYSNPDNRRGDNNYRGDNSTYRGDADRGRYAGNGGVMIPSGTVISVRMIDGVDSDVTRAGDSFRASLDQPIIVNGQTIASAGSDAMVQVVRVQQGGRLEGREEVALALASISMNGRTINLNTSNETVSSSSRGKQSGEVIGGGAALGAIIGAIAGGGKGAAIGAASGAALGTGAQVVRGQRVKVAPETRLSFTLSQDVLL